MLRWSVGPCVEARLGLMVSTLVVELRWWLILGGSAF